MSSLSDILNFGRGELCYIIINQLAHSNNIKNQLFEVPTNRIFWAFGFIENENIFQKSENIIKILQLIHVLGSLCHKSFECAKIAINLICQKYPVVFQNNRHLFYSFHRHLFKSPLRCISVSPSLLEKQKYPLDIIHDPSIIIVFTNNTVNDNCWDHDNIKEYRILPSKKILFTYIVDPLGCELLGIPSKLWEGSISHYDDNDNTSFDCTDYDNCSHLIFRLVVDNNIGYVEFPPQHFPCNNEYLFRQHENRENMDQLLAPNIKKYYIVIHLNGQPKPPENEIDPSIYIPPYIHPSFKTKNLLVHFIP